MATGTIALKPFASNGWDLSVAHQDACKMGVLAGMGVISGFHAWSSPYIPYNSESGAIAPGYFDACLADRIIPIPALIEFGIVSQMKTKPLILWNTHSHSVTLSTLTNTASGVTSSFGVGGIISAYLDISSTITAALEGAAIIDGRLLYLFNTGQLSRTTITGMRGLIFVYPPLVNTYEETDSFSTNTFTALDGTELRESYVSIAKKTFRYQFKSETDEQFAEVQNKIEAASRVPIIHPIWSSVASLTQATSGIVTIYVDTVSTDFQVGDYLIFYVSETSFDVKQILVAGSGQVTVNSATETTFASGTTVYPARISYLSRSTAFTPEYEYLGAWTEFEIEAVEA